MNTYVQLSAKNTLLFKRVSFKQNIIKVNINIQWNYWHMFETTVWLFSFRPFSVDGICMTCANKENTVYFNTFVHMEQNVVEIVSFFTSCKWKIALRYNTNTRLGFVNFHWNIPAVIECNIFCFYSIFSRSFFFYCHHCLCGCDNRKYACPVCKWNLSTWDIQFHSMKWHQATSFAQH